MHNNNYKNWFALLGRLLVCTIFLVSTYAKVSEWHTTVAMLSAKGLPAPQFLLVVATLIELFGGLALLTGIAARPAAFILFLYLIPVTLVIHSFWNLPGAQMMTQLVNFLKNLAIMGGLLFISAYGPGRFSFGKERYASDDEYLSPIDRESKAAQRVR